MPLKVRQEFIRRPTFRIEHHRCSTCGTAENRIFAAVVELVDTWDLKSHAHKAYGFESRRRYQWFIPYSILRKSINGAICQLYVRIAPLQNVC